MNEDMKFIITELNKLLGKNYNLISFNALSSEELIQLLSDVLSEVQQQKGPKIDTSLEDPEQRSIRMFSILRVLKYLPKNDPVSFRQGLVVGDPETIHATLKWILSNIEIARQRAYLSRFLVMVEVPPEYLGDIEIANLYRQYESLVDEFKLIHKEYKNGKKIGETASELKFDVAAMEKEKEIILGRIEKMRSRTESGAYLLEVCRLLRREKDRERELKLQKKQEMEAYEHLQVSIQRLEREFQTLKRSESSLTPEILIQRLSEEITVQTAFLNERLPAELIAKRNYVNALKVVMKSSYTGTDEISMLRNKLDMVAREVQNLMEKKSSENGSDKMAPFRQQAIAVSSMKRNALNQLEKAESNLAELEVQLEERKKDTKYLLEQPLPSEGEFKQYVAKLKAKSVIYKRYKAELSGLKAENGVLSRTNEILNVRLNQMRLDYENQSADDIPIPRDFLLENGVKINFELQHSVTSLQTQLTSLLTELKEARQKLHEVDEKYGKLMKIHEYETSTENKTLSLTQEVNYLKKNVKENTQKIKIMHEKFSKLRIMDERIQHETKEYITGDLNHSIKDEMNESIEVEGKKLEILKEEEKKINESIATKEYQTQQWRAVISILECKLQCAEDNKKKDGIVVRGGGIETLILQ